MEKKTLSFYDWEVQFSIKRKRKDIKKRDETNSLGIKREEWDSFMMEWKKKNLC